jgi:hypothetical protein
MAETGAANDRAHLQHEQDSVNLESPSAEIPNRALAQATHGPAGESAGGEGGRTALHSQNAPAPNCESRQFELEMTTSAYDSLWLDIRAAPLKHLDPLCREVWARHAAGKLTDGEAQGLAEMIRDRQRPEMACRTRQVVRVSHAADPSRRSPSTDPARVARRAPRSPDRMRSLERRRKECSLGWLPPAIAARFSEAERAALAVIAKEIKVKGECTLFNDQLAAYAGVSPSTVKNAKRRAKWLGLIEVTEWKLAPDWNAASRIKIVSPEWAMWLTHHREPKMTGKRLATTRNQKDKRSRFAAGFISRRQDGEGGGCGNAQRGYRTEAGGNSVPRTAPG